MQQRNFVLVAFTLALLTGCSGSNRTVPPSLVFDTPGLFPLAGAQGRDLMFADVDRDGVEDAIVALQGNNQLAWLGGQHPSGFASPHAYGAAVRPDVLAAGDLDDDQVIDLVTGSSANDTLAESHNQGGGNYGRIVGYTLPTPTRDLQIMDATGDGLADVVSASATVSELHILPGNGHGALGAPIAVSLAAIPGDISIADFDGNGTSDLVTAANGGSVVLMLPRSASGGFAAAIESPTDPLAGKLATGDLDNDGVSDLVVLGLARNSVDSLRGSGAGQFARVATQRQAGLIDSLALADVDGDGPLDLLTGAGTEIRIAYGNGDGSFGAPEIAVVDPAGLSAVTTRDVNGDGRPDICYLTARDELGMLLNPLPSSPGLVPYGTGTPDCLGSIVLTGNSRPYPGNLEFSFVGRNALPRSRGLLLIGFRQDLAGSDPFGVRVEFHVSVGPEVNPRYVVADANGRIEDPYAIPDLPGLVGATIYAQTLWFDGPTGGCSTSPLGFSSSRGLSLTIQTP
jgi:hypothetical protein